MILSWEIYIQVYPGLDGLMVDLELSQDNKFAAAYTNNNEIILLNTLVSEFVKITNPFKEERDSSSEVTQVEGNCSVFRD